MFTGIVQAIGRVRQVTPRGGDVEESRALAAEQLRSCGLDP